MSDSVPTDSYCSKPSHAEPLPIVPVTITETREPLFNVIYHKEVISAQYPWHTNQENQPKLKRNILVPIVWDRKAVASDVSVMGILDLNLHCSLFSLFTHSSVFLCSQISNLSYYSSAMALQGALHSMATLINIILQTLLRSLLACSFYTFLDIFHYNTANPGQHFNQWKAAVGPGSWNDEIDRSSHDLSILMD